MGSQPESIITLPASNQRAASKLSAMPKNLNITHPDEAPLPNDTLSDLFNQPVFARAVASFHVTAGRQLTSNVIDGQRIGTIQGQEQTLRLRIHKKRLTVESALVVESDFLTRNGVIQILDKVNFPPTASILDHLREGNFSIFIDLLNQTNPNLLKLLEDTSKTFTVFAPSDAALNSTMPPGMLQRLLVDPVLLNKIHLPMTYHVQNEEFISNVKYGTIGASSYQRLRKNQERIASPDGLTKN
ncbi:periostin [Trichonephila clavipes]|nr:periostin [Trichonephila clavipes]